MASRLDLHTSDKVRLLFLRPSDPKAETARLFLDVRTEDVVKLVLQSMRENKQLHLEGAFQICAFLIQQLGQRDALRRIDEDVSDFVDRTISKIRGDMALTAQDFRQVYDRDQAKLLAKQGVNDDLSRQLVVYPVLYDAVYTIKSELRKEVGKIDSKVKPPTKKDEL